MNSDEHYFMSLLCTCLSSLWTCSNVFFIFKFWKSKKITMWCDDMKRKIIIISQIWREKLRVKNQKKWSGDTWRIFGNWGNFACSNGSDARDAYSPYLHVSVQVLGLHVQPDFCTSLAASNGSSSGIPALAPDFSLAKPQQLQAFGV